MVSAMLKKRTPEVPNSLPGWLQQALRQALTFDTAARPSVALLHKVHQILCRQQHSAGSHWRCQDRRPIISIVCSASPCCM